jgi:hypothetical protein
MDPLNIAIVAGLFALVALIGWIDRHNLLARWWDRTRARGGRQLPPGRHRVEGAVGIDFGHDDATLILKIPLQIAGARRLLTYVGATDGCTRFTVDHEETTPDAVLAAYDDSLGPLTIQVSEPGTIAEIDISRDAAPNGVASGTL